MTSFKPLTVPMLSLAALLAACSPARDSPQQNASQAPHQAAEQAPRPPAAGSPGTAQRYPKPDKAALRERLTQTQFEVTQNNGTERPFSNAYWDNKREGLYVDIVSGEPLFSSSDKFVSGTGWPSFTKPVEKTRVVDVVDATHGMRRVEVRSRDADSHLGHVFDDGPRPTGLRYCINSASMRFIPVDKLVEAGYGEYLPLFKR